MAAPVVAAAAFMASAAHVLTGPDHLAAVLPLAIEHRRQALYLGAYWGLGHGLGVAVLGALSRFVLAQVDLSTLSHACETLVGLLLVWVGVRAVRNSRLVVVHAHDHGHGTASEHAHLHLHVADASLHRPDHGRLHSHRHGALGFGLLHGVAGGGHLLGALPALALTPRDAAVYFAAYLLGAVLAMSAFAAVCGRVVSPATLPGALRWAGVATVGIGLIWVGGAWYAA